MSRFDAFFGVSDVRGNGSAATLAPPRPASLDDSGEVVRRAQAEMRRTGVAHYMLTEAFHDFVADVLIQRLNVELGRRDAEIARLSKRIGELEAKANGKGRTPHENDD